MARKQKVSNEDMLKLRNEGWGNVDIAEILQISRHTVRRHIGPTPEDIATKNRRESIKKIAKPTKKKAEAAEPKPIKVEAEPVAATPVETEVKPKVEEKCDKTPQIPSKNVIPTPILAQKSETPKKWPPTIPVNLFDFAYVPSWSETLACIADKVNPEPWCFLNPVKACFNAEYQILETHIKRTFTEYAYRYNLTSAEESSKHFLIRSKYAILHTGLYTEDQRDIYMFFTPNPVTNTKMKWAFAGVDVNTCSFLRKIHPLPNNTVYRQARTMVFHTEREVRIATEHILGQEATAARIPESIRKSWNASLLLETAVEYSRREAVSNKTLAIPCCRTNQEYFLLPLWLTNRDKPDVYALLEDNGEFYTCGTVLTPQQAYFDARMCGKVAQRWLRDLVEE